MHSVTWWLPHMLISTRSQKKKKHSKGPFQSRKFANRLLLPCKSKIKTLYETSWWNVMEYFLHFQTQCVSVSIGRLSTSAQRWVWADWWSEQETAEQIIWGLEVWCDHICCDVSSCAIEYTDSYWNSENCWTNYQNYLSDAVHLTNDQCACVKSN